MRHLPLISLLTILLQTHLTHATWLHKYAETKSLNSQLVLDCPSEDDLIWVGWSHYGTKAAPSDTPLAQLSESDCWMNFTEKISEQCNGAPQCDISAQPTYIHKCSKISDYLYISYKCYGAAHTVDICERKRVQSNIAPGELFIRSPDFPDEYPASVDCSCKIESTRKLRLDVLWFSVQDNDVLAVNGRNVTAWMSPASEMRLAEGYKASLRFSSDDALAYKGFWLKTAEMRSCRDASWNLVGNSCLKVFSEQLDWRAANQRCKSMNGYLARDDDVVADLKLTQFMKLNYPDVSSYWIGLRKYMDETNKEKWMWSSNSSRYEDESWWPWRAQVSTGNCVIKRRAEDGFFAIACEPSNKHSFICQADSLSEDAESKSEISIECGPTVELAAPTASTTTSRTSPKLAEIGTKANKMDLTSIWNSIPTSIKQKIISNSLDESKESVVKSFEHNTVETDKLSTAIIAGIVCGIGIVILLINIIVLVICKRNLKKLIKNTKSDSQPPQELYFDSYSAAHMLKSGGGTLLMPSSANATSTSTSTSSTSTAAESDTELFGESFSRNNKSLGRQSAFKTLQPHQYDKLTVSRVQKGSAQCNYDQLNTNTHTYESLDALEASARRVQVGKIVGNQFNPANYSHNSTDFMHNSTATSLSSALSANNLLRQKGAHVILLNNQKMTRNDEGTWSPDSAYYSSILTGGSMNYANHFNPHQQQLIHQLMFQQQQHQQQQFNNFNTNQFMTLAAANNSSNNKIQSQKVSDSCTSHLV